MILQATALLPPKPNHAHNFNTFYDMQDQILHEGKGMKMNKAWTNMTKHTILPTGLAFLNNPRLFYNSQLS